MTTAVVGAGIIGVTTAWMLRQTGRDVILIDRHQEAGKETTAGNAGLLVPSQAEPWNKPAMILQALWWLLAGRGPFEIKGVNGSMLRWLTQFVAASHPPTWRRNAAAVLKLAERSQELTKGIAEAEGIDFANADKGVITLLRGQNSSNMLASLARLGVTAKWLCIDELSDLEPTLRPVIREFSGAILTPDDWSGESIKFAQALAQLAVDEGVTFMSGFEVNRIIRTNREFDLGALAADEVVLAAGIESRQLAAGLDVDLPMQRVVGVSLTIDIGDWPERPRRPVRDPAYQVAITPLGSHLRIAGKAILASDPYQPTAADRIMIEDNLKRVFPGVNRAALSRARLWSGARPMTPDGCPLIGATPVPNFYVNTGHGHLGWTLACGSAERLVQIIGK